MGIFLIVIEVLFLIATLVFSFSLVFAPKKFYALMKGVKIKKVVFQYKDLPEPNASYIKNSRMIGLLLVLIFSTSSGKTIMDTWKLTVPSERNMNKVVEKASYVKLEYYVEPTFNIMNFYKSEQFQLTNQEVNNIKNKELGSIRFYQLFPNYPKEKVRNMEFTYDFEPLEYVSLVMYNSDDKVIGKITYFSEDEVMFFNENQRHALIKGDDPSLYEYLMSLREDHILSQS